MNEISVTQLNNYIKSVFVAEEMLHNISVVGEVDGISVRGSAVWFSLKDRDAVISCVCWDKTRFRGVENGDKVTARGTVDYWNKAGKINFTVAFAAKFGVGDLLEQLRQLTEKLKAEGLFDRKKPLPARVRRIGVITSRGGAVIHDIISVTRRRNRAVDIVLFPASVQGDAAEGEILRGIDYFSTAKTVDIVIIARGGGAKEDLNAFNSESVARAVAGCPLPVISAIGHETDTTLTDFVADLRAPTPSAAAEMAVPELKTNREIVTGLWRQIKNAVLNKFERLRAEIKNYENMLYLGLVTITKNGIPVKSVREVKINDDLLLRLNDGIIKAKVTDKNGK
jgi:exodeoxyribonuclease VII large subunit